MVLNRSCPAVSLQGRQSVPSGAPDVQRSRLVVNAHHIWSLIFFPSNSTVRILKSIPAKDTNVERQRLRSARHECHVTALICFDLLAHMIQQRVLRSERTDHMIRQMMKRKLQLGQKDRRCGRGSDHLHAPLLLL